MRKFGAEAWCGKWSTSFDESFCILNGGSQSVFCPGAWQLTINGQYVDNYYSTDPLICQKAESKSIILVIVYFDARLCIRESVITFFLVSGFRMR